MRLLRLAIQFFLVVIVFVMFFHPITAMTQDLGRHLLTGKIIIQTHTIPKTNLYSYTYPNFTFINHHWLSEVLFYVIQTSLGFFGLLLSTSLVATLAFFLQFLYLKKQALIPLLFVALLYFRILLERTELRPEIFSFLFLSLFMVILYRNRNKFTRWIFVLPFLELLWVDMHIYFPIGIAIFGLFLIEHVILKITKKQTLYDRYTGILVFVLCTCLGAIIINPNTIQGALYPLHVFQNYGYSIEENQNVFFLWSMFQKSTLLYFFIAAPLLFLTLLLGFKKTKPIDWLLCIFFSVLAVSAERNLPLFVFGTFIPFVRSLSYLFEKIIKIIQEYPVLKISAVILFLVFVVWQTLQIVTFKPIDSRVPIGAEKGVDFLLKNNISGPIFNNFDIGSFFEYRLYPKEKVFVDGRPEAYPASFFQNTYIPMQQDPTVFKQVDKNYHFSTIFFSHTDQTPWAHQFLQYIIKDSTWHLVYLDESVLIFVKQTAQTSSLVKNHEITQADSSHISTNEKTQASLSQLAVLFDTFSWKDQEIHVLQELLSLNPTFCPALYNLSMLTASQKNPVSDIYLTKYSQNCH